MKEMSAAGRSRVLGAIVDAAAAEQGREYAASELLTQVGRDFVPKKKLLRLNPHLSYRSSRLVRPSANPSPSAHQRPNPVRKRQTLRQWRKQQPHQQHQQHRPNPHATNRYHLCADL